jgi:hypothetical protein
MTKFRNRLPQKTDENGYRLSNLFLTTINKSQGNLLKHIPTYFLTFMGGRTSIRNSALGINIFTLSIVKAITRSPLQSPDVRPRVVMC